MSSLDKDKLKNGEAPDELESVTPEAEPLTLEDLEQDVTTDAMSFTATWHFEFDDILKAIEHMDQDPDPELVTEPAEPETALESATEPVVESETAEPEPETESQEADTESENEIEESMPEPEVMEPETESVESVEFERGPEPDTEQESTESEPGPDTLEPDLTAEQESTDPDLESESPGPKSEPEPETQATEPASETAVETAEPEPAPELAPGQAPEKSRSGLVARFRGKDTGTKKLVLTDIILLLIIVASVAAGLVIANGMVDKANAANEAKISEMKANIQEVDLADSLYEQAADQVIEDVAVPTYTLDELYALDLREPTGFTANDLKMITRKGLVGCEEAFVKAEETYGVNCIFLMSIASLESAYGTQMFRPNNMFGYGRTGFSSKQEGIMTVAKGLGTRYLNPAGSLYGGSPTLKGVNKRYAANPQWYYKVGKYMQGYYEKLAAEKNSALDKFE